MPSGYQDLYLEQGTTFSTSLTLTDNTGAPYNLTNFVVTSVAKKSYYSKTPYIIFDAEILNPTTGTINISANSSVTSNISSIQKLVYDVKIKEITSNNVTRVIEGQIFVSPAVS